jgi:hypothetical protein
MSEHFSALSELLQKLFPANVGLHPFVLGLDGGAAVADALPGKDASPQDYRIALVQLLLARGLADERFFRRLESMHPKQAQTIGRVRKTLLQPDTLDDATRTNLPKALLRGLQPFGQDDRLFGRKMEVQAIETIVTGDDFRLGVVLGRTGCGKTSLLRAGLMPRLAQRGFEAIYLPRPAALAQTLEAMLAAGRSDGEEPAGAAGRIVVVDQCEELFLQQPDSSAHAPLATLIAQCLRTEPVPIRVLVGIRDDLFHKLRYFSPQIPDPLRPANCYELEEFRRETAVAILRESRVTDGTEFDDALIDAVVADLASDGLVRPVELQIVGTQLKRQRVWHEAEYVQRDRATGLLRTYIESELKSTPDSFVAARVLRRLCDLDRPGKARVDVTTDELVDDLREAGVATAKPETVEIALERLRLARLVVETEQGRHNLIHDYLARLVILATEGVESEATKAVRLLGRYVAEYRDDRDVRVPFTHLWRIRRHARAAIAADPLAKKLVRASMRSALGHAVVPSVVILGLGFASAYALLSTTRYLDVEPPDFPGAGEKIVLKAGHPSLKALPGFDQILIDTGYTMRDVSLDQVQGYDIPGEVLWSFTGKVENGYESWVISLAERLRIDSRIRALRMIGETTAAFDIAVKVAFSKRAPSFASLAWMVPAWPNSFDTFGVTGFSTGEFLARLSSVSDDAKAERLLLLRQFMQSADATPNNKRLLYEKLMQQHLIDSTAPVGPSSLPSADASQSIIDHALHISILSDPSLIRREDATAVFQAVVAGETSVERKSVLWGTLEVMALANEDIASDVLSWVITALFEKGPTHDMPWEGTFVREIFTILWNASRANPLAVSDAMLESVASEIEKKRYAAIAYALLTSHRDVRPHEASRLHVTRCAERKISEGKGLSPELRRWLLADFMTGKSLKYRDLVNAEACAMTLVRSGNLGDDERHLRRALASRQAYIANTALQFLAAAPSAYRNDMTPQRWDEEVIKAMRSGDFLFDLELPDEEASNFIYETGRINQALISVGAVRALAGDYVNDLFNSKSLKLFDATRWQPGLILEIERDLLKPSLLRSSSGGPEFREATMAILARARYEVRRVCTQSSCSDSRYGSLPVQLSEIAALLKTRTSYERRIDGVYATYLHWLDTPRERKQVEFVVDEQSRRPEPELRVAANMAREMIQIGAWTQVGGAVTPGLALARIRYFESIDDVHTRFAARLAMERWIDATAEQRRTH